MFLFPGRKRIDPNAIRYGTFTHRMLASTIDIGVLFLFATSLVDYIMAQVFLPLDINAITAVLGSDSLRIDPSLFLKELWAVLEKQHIIERVIIENGIEIAIIAGYMLPFWFRYSTSPGMFLFRLQIQDEKTGAPMTRRQAVIRFLGFFVSAIPFSLGFVWIVFNKKRQGFHDLIAGTVVIVKPKQKKALPQPQVEAASAEPPPTKQP